MVHFIESQSSKESVDTQGVKGQVFGEELEMVSLSVRQSKEKIKRILQRKSMTLLIPRQRVEVEESIYDILGILKRGVSGEP